MNDGKGSGTRVVKWMVGLFVLGFCYFLPWANDWDQNSRLDLTLAMVNHGAVSIDRERWNTEDLAYVHGHYYTITAPGQSFLGLPAALAYKELLTVTAGSHFASGVGQDRHPSSKIAYFMLQWLEEIFSVALPAIVLLLLFFWFLGHLSSSILNRVILTLGLGFGTMIFPYAKTFYSHVPATALLFAAFCVVHVLASPTEPRGKFATWIHSRPGMAMLLAGLLMGLAEVFEYPAILISAMISLYAALHVPRRFLLPLVMGGLPGLGIIMTYDQIVYHSPFLTGYSGHSVLWKSRLANGISGFSWPPRPAALWGMSFSPYRGLFFLSPFLLLSVAGFIIAARKRVQGWPLLLCISAGYFTFIAMCPFWEAGSTLGPRYLILTLPFLALPIIYVLDRAAPFYQWLGVRVLIAISVVSVLVETVGSVGGYPSAGVAVPLLDSALPSIFKGQIEWNIGTFMVGPALGPNSVVTLAPLVLMLALWTWMSFRHRETKKTATRQAEGVGAANVGS